MPEIDGFDSLVSKLNQAKTSSKELEKTWEKINTHAKEAVKNLGKIGGGTGGPGGSGTGGGGGGMPGPGDMNVNVRSTGAPRSNITSPIFGLGDIATYAGEMQGAFNTFLPDVKNTMNRATSYYNAGVYGGSAMSRQGLQNATFGTLGRMQGLSSAGSDARVAQFLGQRGMTASADTNSTYQRTIRTIGNAARYMNISNEEAAASVEGLTNASGAANMLRNFGIYTADLGTGKEKSQTEIFEELAQRLTAGRGQANVEQTQASIRRGALGVTIDSFFKGDQQGGQMFKQYMIERARGKKMDFSGTGDTASKIGIAGNVNPLNAQMAMAASDTQAMQDSEKQFISGINLATGALQLLNKVAGGLGATLGSLASMVQTLMGHNTVSGALQGATSTVNLVGKAAGSATQFLAMSNPIAAIAASVGVVAAGAGALGLMKDSFGGKTPGAPTGGTGGTGGAYYGSPTSSDYSYGDTTTAGAASSGSSSSSATGYAGAWSTSTTGTTGSSSGGKLFDISIVAGGHNVTAPFGDNAGVHAGTGHRGVDYAYAQGAKVRAIADGVVVSVKSGAVNTYPGGPRNFGNYVAVMSTSKKGKQYTVFYGHLSKPKVALNSKVVRGQVIGLAGNTGYSTGSHLHLEIVKGKQTTPGTGTAVNPNNLKDIAGETALSEGSASTPEVANALQMAEAQKGMDALVGSAEGSNSLLRGFYSGNKDSILASVGAMAAAVGMNDFSQQLAKANGSYLSGPNTPGGGVVTPGGGGGGNNVNITVQVPDVTAADAVKFAQLVKQYLDNDSLISNTGSF